MDGRHQWPFRMPSDYAGGERGDQTHPTELIIRIPTDRAQNTLHYVWTIDSRGW